LSAFSRPSFLSFCILAKSANETSLVFFLRKNSKNLKMNKADPLDTLTYRITTIISGLQNFTTTLGKIYNGENVTFVEGAIKVDDALKNYDKAISEPSCNEVLSGLREFVTTKDGRNLKDKDKTVNGVLAAFVSLIDSLNSFAKKTKDVSLADLAKIQKERKEGLENALKLSELQEENKKMKEKLNSQDQTDKEESLKKIASLTAECKELQMKLLVNENQEKGLKLQKERVIILEEHETKLDNLLKIKDNTIECLKYNLSETQQQVETDWKQKKEFEELKVKYSDLEKTI